MSDSDGPWYKVLWHFVDDALRGLSKGLKRLVRTLRILRFILVLAVLTILADPVVYIVWPQYWQWVHIASTLFLAVPVIILLVLVALPLQAKSIVRLIDKGYPDNVKELGIRLAARKLHEQSIETEELLVDTAVNESRKMYRKYRRRAQKLKEELDAMDDLYEAEGPEDE